MLIYAVDHLDPSCRIYPLTPQRSACAMCMRFELIEMRPPFGLLRTFGETQPRQVHFS